MRTFFLSKVVTWSTLAVVLFPKDLRAESSAELSDTSSPIRIVRKGYGNPEGMRHNIKAIGGLCRYKKKLPMNVDVPSESFLKQLAVHEVEELFDGRMWAIYETRRYLGADAASGCRLVVYVGRRATVQRTCDWELSGKSASVAELTALDGAPIPSPKIVEESNVTRRCKDSPRKAFHEKVPTEPILHVRCHWQYDVFAARFPNLRLSKTEGAVDNCTYHKIPSYIYKGHRRLVVLKNRGSTVSEAGFDMSTFAGGLKAVFDMKATEFSDGTPIAAAKFSRQSIENFINLPNKIPIRENGN